LNNSLKDKIDRDFKKQSKQKRTPESLIEIIMENGAPRNISTDDFKDILNNINDFKMTPESLQSVYIATYDRRVEEQWGKIERIPEETKQEEFKDETHQDYYDTYIDQNPAIEQHNPVVIQPENIQLPQGIQQIPPVENQEPNTDYTFIDFNHIYNNPLEFNPIVSGMFNEGDNVVIHAQGGVGKSLFTTYLSLFLANRQHVCEFNSWPKFLGKFLIPKTRTTLFIQNENSQTAMYQRLKKMITGDSRLRHCLDNLFIPFVKNDICLFGKALNDDAFIDYLIELITRIETQRNKKIDLVVVDPFISFHESEENDNADIRKNVLDKLTDLSKKMRFTPVIVHHDNKNGDIRGASALHDWARSRIHLFHDEMKEKKYLTLSHKKSNNGPTFEDIDLVIDENLIFIPVDRNNVERDNPKTECRVKGLSEKVNKVDIKEKKEVSRNTKKDYRNMALK
jgi:RecA-family ATPase